MTEPTFSAPLETLRKRALEATQRLLGDTIGISDNDWREPSLLPGWTRAHVAAHLAANAAAFTRLVEEAVVGRDTVLYPDPDERFRRLEAGAQLSGLELQITLDTSAGQLQRTLEAVTEWSTPIRLLGRSLTLAHVPIARLSEVVLHHIDLDCGYDATQLDPVPARWLLQWSLLVRQDAPHLPALTLESDSGVTGDVGPGEDRRVVTGSDAALWAWLMGRTGPADVHGADDLTLSLQP